MSFDFISFGHICEWTTEFIRRWILTYFKILAYVIPVHIINPCYALSKSTWTNKET